MTAPEPTIEHLSALLKEAHARVWTKQGKRQPGSTDADHAAWILAWQRLEQARDKQRRRIRIKP